MEKHSCRVVCNDGFSFTVNFGEKTFSSKDSNGDWIEVEVTDASNTDSFLRPFESEQKGVYSYVPVDIVGAMVNMAHGGQVIPEVFDENTIVFVDYCDFEKDLTEEVH